MPRTGVLSQEHVRLVGAAEQFLAATELRLAEAAVQLEVDASVRRLNHRTHVVIRVYWLLRVAKRLGLDPITVSSVHPLDLPESIELVVDVVLDFRQMASAAVPPASLRLH